jgi:hypothetical protein
LPYNAAWRLDRNVDEHRKLFSRPLGAAGVNDFAPEAHLDQETQVLDSAHWRAAALADTAAAAARPRLHKAMFFFIFYTYPEPVLVK